MADKDADLANILANITSSDELESYIVKYAIIVQHLVCCMAKRVHQSEAGIRALYDTWADMAVEQFTDPRTFHGRKLH